MPEMFGSIKTVMVEYLDERYNALSNDVADAATVAVFAVGLVLGGPFSIRTSTI